MKKLEVSTYMGNFEIAIKRGKEVDYNNALVFKNTDTEESFTLVSNKSFPMRKASELYAWGKNNKDYRFPTYREFVIINACMNNLLDWVEKNKIDVKIKNDGYYIFPKKVETIIENPFNNTDTMIVSKYLAYDMTTNKIKLINDDLIINYMVISL